MDSSSLFNTQILNEYEQEVNESKQEPQHNLLDLPNNKNKEKESNISKNENCIFGFNIIRNEDINKEVLIIGFPQKKDINLMLLILNIHQTYDSYLLYFLNQILINLKMLMLNIQKIIFLNL